MTYWAHVLPAAEQDLELIIDRLQAKAVTGAVSWIDAYEQALATVVKNPEIYALIPEARRLGQPLRELLFKTRKGRYYRLIYLVVADEVRILRVRAPGERLLRRSDLE